MVRILYAGYLAFALYLIYPLVQNTLMFSTDCVRSVLPMGDQGSSANSASGVGGHANRCVSSAHAGAATGRVPDIH
ncbi:hypothetical protein KDW19_12740 [Burkholderia cenocepacia]|uniref:Uncharacterized protein n=2 Tax=Burkholderia orbicola TaxID=2978683 RepID=B1K0V3_BURO0|nr:MULTISPECIES: hypothetical protein [Burkholderia]EKS9840546.1 hypothetical protein [Burkholderia cepacia]ESS41269.1 hypothetical protein P355_5030 [Burkholderia cenocepacia KC-01]BEV51632.1 hypothetical protein BconGalA64_41320 [Burkholderia contaminans]ABK08336.1 conserved hypothetical protein [Burkholderia cenocepacia HI2424]ACA90734.1 conserved hypothetical protein [Burkholderia orbicola MC0-3]